MPTYHIYSSAENSITIELGNEINEETHKFVMALYRHIDNAGITCIKDIIPAYTSVTVVYDLMLVIKERPLFVYGYMHEKIKALADSCNWNAQTGSRHLTIPVCYDLSLATDIEKMAKAKQLTTDEIIKLHTTKTYKVYMLGFLPGFAYMGVVDELITMPRLSQPRLQVAAGSVGIAGNQTGIYPLDSPGGWNIIGQTPVQLFDASLNEPCYFQPDDIVQFVPISLREFDQLKML